MMLSTGPQSFELWSAFQFNPRLVSPCRIFSHFFPIVSIAAPRQFKGTKKTHGSNKALACSVDPAYVPRLSP